MGKIKPYKEQDSPKQTAQEPMMATYHQSAIPYYLIDENRIVIAAMLHSKQSPETVRKTISEFLKQYK